MSKELESLFYKNEDQITKYVDMGSHEVATYFINKETADSSKPIIVFISGLGEDHTSWTKDDIIEDLSETNDVLLYDRGISGNSNLLNDEEYKKSTRGIQEMTNELEVVINSYSKDRKIILVGHSLGGYIMRQILRPK